MKSLTIRNIPDDLYQTIVEIAKRNNRSIQQQLLVFLDRARILNRKSPTDRAKAIRKNLMGRFLGNTVLEIKEERER